MERKREKVRSHREVVHKLIDYLLDREKRVKRGVRCPRWFPSLDGIPSFLDHMGRYREDGTRRYVLGEPSGRGDVIREYVTGEPYGMDSDMVRDLIKFCDRNNFDFHISADSGYYPGASVLVRIFKKDT
jgi:hypothetical protein